MFENAKWVGMKVNQSPSPYSDGSTYFQRVFVSNGVPERATLSCVGLGYGYFYINGVAVSADLLPTPTTKFDARVIYSTYDVTALVKEGENVIGAYVGNGWYNDVGNEWNFEKSSWRAERKMICQLDLLYADGHTQSVVSDKSFRCADGPSVYNHVREGEIYDNRLAIDDFASVAHPEFLPVRIVHSPGGILEPMRMPPIRCTRRITPVRITDTVWDVGEAISGWMTLCVEGAAGTEIHLTYSEIFEDGDIRADNINCYTYGKLRHEDIFILRGEGRETFHPSFMYHAFRYVKVEGAPETISLTAEVVHTDLRSHASFTTSDTMINSIHVASLHSTLYNYHHLPTDCPHREQNGWTGDMLCSAQQTIMNFEMRDAYRKVLGDLCDAQRPSGQLPGIVPTTSWGYNWGSGPAWDSLLILMPGQFYDIEGDLSLIEEFYDAMERYMAFFATMADGYLADFGLGDWLPVQKEHITPSIVTDTAFYYADACAMARYARLLFRDPSHYDTLSENIRRVWRDAFMQDESLLSHQTFLSCGIALSLFDEEEKSDMAARLNALVIRDGYHINCGILGAKWIFTALGEYGYNETLYKMVTNPTPPSYAWWILQGQTTLAETWMLSDNNSRFHHMYSEVEHWFYRYLGGLRYEEGRLTVAPVSLSAIDTLEVVRCGVSVSYDRETVTVCSDVDFTLALADGTKALSAGTYRFERSRLLP